MAENKLELQFKLRGVAKDHPALRVAMALVAEHDGVRRCIGSAFAVAPGLAITASHVVQECITYQERRDGYKRHDSAIALTAAQSHDDTISIWVVDAIYGSVASDVAFLRFGRPEWWKDSPSQLQPMFARLNFNPPSVGDKVRVFGFPDSELDGRLVNVFPAECECRVQEVNVKVDEPAWNKPLSHIVLEGEIQHGMSGGPCLDKDWNVIGVNSSSWSGIPLAKVALLWPAMRVEIDLFKTGAFPAIDLFTTGDTQALGYKRIYVTSKGETRLARVDPDSLKLTSFMGRTEDVPKAIDFAAAGASEALAELKDLMAKARAGSPLFDVGRVLRLTRYFFWELEAALTLSILLAARQAGLSIPEPPSWEQLRNALKARTPKGDVLDEIESLNFEWTGVDLFDARAYAELGRSAVIWSQSTILNSGPQKGRTVACSFEPPCRDHGQQLFLPEGLDRFMEASRRFVQRLLRLSRVARVTDAR